MFSDNMGSPSDPYWQAQKNDMIAQLARERDELLTRLSSAERERDDARLDKIKLAQERDDARARLADALEREQKVVAFLLAWHRGDYTVTLRDSKTDYTASAELCRVFEPLIVRASRPGQGDAADGDQK